jgi:hypothetical protein
MRDHDLELIAALVEGRLEDETEARALLESSPELLAEYEAQRLAYEALRGLGPMTLSDTERARLHRDVWTELRSDTQAQPARRPWYYTWASVAAGLFVVVGLVTVLNQNLGGGDEGVFLAADQTTALLDAPTEEGAQSDAGGGDGAAPEITDDSGDGPTATTMAASESPPVAQLSAEAENLRQGEFAGDLEPYGEDATRSSAIEACVERANLNGYEVAALLTPSEDTAVSTTNAGDELDGSTTTTVAEVTEDRLAVAVPAGADPATAPVAFVDLTTCEVVYLDE